MASSTSVVLESLVDLYPHALRPRLAADVRRQRFQVDMVRALAPGGRLVDIGGGVASFAAACAALGMDATVVDDFSDPINAQHGADALKAHQRYGVSIVDRDVIDGGLGMAPGSVDVITTFDSMEHWHHSPKRLFAEVMAVLRPGGWFLLGVPNAVNIRKRLTVPFGKGKWSQMVDWYEQPVFRGHVREPDVEDLHYIADDMALENPSVFGRNWLGYRSKNAVVRRLTPLIDGALQHAPGLCSDIYLLGQRPHRA